MPVKMRLRRMGAKHQPSYRIVIADSRTPRDGRYLDQVGFYNPLTNPATITLDQEKAVEWLRKGAQPTDTVEKLLSKFDINLGLARRGERTGGGTGTSPVSVRGTATQETRTIDANEVGGEEEQGS